MIIKKILIFTIACTCLIALPIKKSFNVEGMMCGKGCVTTINTTIKSLNGVTECKVYFDKKLMEVTFDNSLTNQDDIIKSLSAPYIASLLVDMKMKEYSVTGMHCQGCVNTLKASLEKIIGIQYYNIDFNKKSLVIEYDNNIIEDTKIQGSIPDKFTIIEIVKS